MVFCNILSPQHSFSITDNFSISPDGKKIVMILKDDQKRGQQDINIILNWKKELKNKLNGKKSIKGLTQKF